MSDPKFWTLPVDLDLLGYKLKFRYPSIEAAADANEIREAGASTPERIPFRARAKRYWELLREHLISIERDGEILSDEDRDGLFASTAFAPWLDQLVTACFFRDALIAMANSAGGLGRSSARSEGSGEDPNGGSGRQIPGLSDDMPSSGLARLDGDGTAQRGMVPGLREEKGAVTGDSTIGALAGSNGRGSGVRTRGTPGGGVGRTRKAKA